MGYLNDLISGGRVKSRSPLSALTDSYEPPASIAAPAPRRESYSVPRTELNPAWNTQSNNVYQGVPPQQSVIQNTPTFGIGTPDSGGYGGAPQPEPKAAPVMSESDWLAGDSEYQNQLSQFDSSLQDFLGRLATQKSDFTNDYNTAMTGFGRNKDQGMLNLGEDFTSRGLANSGLFNDQRNKTETMFQGQENAMKTSKTRAEADFTNQESDKRKSTDQARGNARLSSLGRMSMKQMF